PGRLQDAGPRHRRHHHNGSVPRDRSEKAEGHERPERRAGGAQHRRLRPFHGHPGDGELIAMAKIGKRMAQARGKVDASKVYGVSEAVKLVKENAKAKFDETIEIAVNLGVDPKQ